jgi:hypothetical protein
VKEQVAPFHSTVQGVRIAEITGDAFYIEFTKLAVRPAKGADAVAILTQDSGDVPAQESGGSGD